MSMTDFTLDSWPRPFFVPLPLKSFYFFVIYGTLDETFPAIPTEAYRSLGLPEGLELNFHALEDRVALREEFQHGTGWERLCSEAPQAVNAIQEAPACVVLRGELPDAEDLDRLRDCIGLIMFMLDNGGEAVCDVLTGDWYSSLDWRLLVFEEEHAAANSLIAFHSIEQLDGKLHLYTRGMRRFARPDLSIEDVQPEDESSRVAILSHIASNMIDGGSIPEGQQLQFPDLDVSLTCHWQGSLDDPLFYNFWLRLQLKTTDLVRT